LGVVRRAGRDGEVGRRTAQIQDLGARRRGETAKLRIVAQEIVSARFDVEAGLERLAHDRPPRRWQDA
jgi:hypothetical protein